MWNTMWNGTLLGDLAALQSSVSNVMEYPALRVHENDDGIVVRTEVPGVMPEDIQVELKSDTLTITVEKKAESIAEGARRLRRERRTGKFSRSFELPFHADREAISADYTNGVLTISLPRAEEEKPRRISVQAG